MNIIRLQGDAEIRAGIYYEYDVDSKPLGEGGMGRVFKGFRVNQRTGERMPVAIKAIYENIPERVVERARREAAIQIDHDNLIRMYGFVEAVTPATDKSPQRVHYHVIMELLIGVTLEDMLNGITDDKHGVQIPFAKEIYSQYMNHRVAASSKIIKSILSGLMSLHDKGIIHRDIDPSNVMITLDKKIKLIDFGICKQIVSLESQDKGLTSSGVFMGKVNYAAPELVLGDVKSQNYTTDIYAVGVLFYQLMAGHLPFTGTDQDILAGNLRKPFPMKDVKRADVKKIIKKATEKSQDKRYSSVSEMRVDIEHLNLNDKNAGKSNKNWLIAACTMGAIVIASVIAIIITNNQQESKESETIAEESTSVVREEPSSSELYSQALAYLSMPSSDSVAQGNKIMMKLANDSAYAPSMFELGLTYAKANKFFSTPSQRQEQLGIKPDLAESIKWLNKALEINPADYRAAYWIVNNLIEKVDAGTADDDDINQLKKTHALFTHLVESSTAEDASLYREAMKSDEPTLRAWGIIY